MIRTSLAQAYVKRTCRPLYGWTQMTAVHTYLDPNFDRSTPIYPGMVMMRTEGDLVSLIDATGVPFGLSSLFVGGFGIDEPAEAGVNAFAVWVFGGPDAQVEIDAPAFDADASWVDPGDGTELLVHAYTGAGGTTAGVLAPAGASNITTQPVARLLKINSDTTITIGGLRASGQYS